MIICFIHFIDFSFHFSKKMDYHYNYGEGLSFKGMLYPYGDFLPYADAQTSILMTLKALKPLGLNFESYELMIVQLLPILAMMVGLYFIVRLLQRFELPLYISE